MSDLIKKQNNKTCIVWYLTSGAMLAYTVNWIQILIWKKFFPRFIFLLFYKLIITEHNVYKQNEMQHCLGKESALGAGGGVERVALIKS